MTALTILLVVLLLLTVLLIVETPIAMALALAGFVGIALSGNVGAGWAVLGSAPYSDTAVYTLAVVPMYILMGMLAHYARIPEDMYTVAARALRGIPGGMGAATILACAGFGAVNGSSVATAATFAKLSVGEMIKHGYKPAYAAAIVASAGTLGMIIPPSIVLVIYGIITGESIGKMLVAGIIPGIIIALVFTLHSVTLGRRHVGAPLARVPSLVGAAASSGKATINAGPVDLPPSQPREGSLTIDSDRPRLPIGGLLKAALLFSIVVLGIYGGFMTITESAGVAVVVALILLLWTRRTEGFKKILRLLGDSLSSAASTTTMAMTTLFGATVFGYYLVSSGVPSQFARWVTGLDIPPGAVVAIFLATLIPIGMVLESIPMMLIFLPLTYPVVEALGFNGIWFGILVIIMVELGMICPPIGLNVFVVANVTPGVRSSEIYKYSIVFVTWLLVVVAFLFIFPDVVLWLPDLVR